MNKIKQIIEFLKQNKKVTFFLIIIILIIIITQVITFFYLKYQLQNINTKNNIVKEEIKEVSTNLIKVEIKGEIINPGIYEMNDTERVNDVIIKAGGLTKNANTKANNLSGKLSDEMVIIIYSNEEIKNFETVTKKEQQISANCNKSINSVTNSSCKDNKTKNQNTNDTVLVSINSGSKDELMTLPGIGESKANSIIKYRDSNGLFSNISEIKNVSGIGEALYAQIKDFITT